MFSMHPSYYFRGIWHANLSDSHRQIRDSGFSQRPQGPLPVMTRPHCPFLTPQAKVMKEQQDAPAAPRGSRIISSICLNSPSAVTKAPPA